MKFLPVLLLVIAAPVSAATVTGTAHVVDGDTIAVGETRIRIHGIDAPEAGQRCEGADGRSWRCDDAATKRMADLANEKMVSCEVRDVDDYGRLVSVCRADGIDIGGDLIDRGLAWAFVRYSNEYVSREAAAKAAGVGVWKDGARPLAPWDFRRDRWTVAEQATPREGCPIKGNIARDGERIYHTPWSPWYAKTRIDVSKGERWFCDEAEALKAGWRPAKFR